MTREHEQTAGPGSGGHCTWCGAPLEPVEVHGHVQCGSCGINVDPCCGGEQACG